uniref:Ribosome production factor 2 homolog n=1 Tax=Albugo laibachii Nc14 TaxID=890382 RepID=F0W9T3_9STRA|nr:conserved hypothetical protein [Albugo laibachii Nc14]|eukprot:CCA17901.1 conserved hypothetical protein [Albugo laibachii Nc14]
MTRVSEQPNKSKVTRPKKQKQHVIRALKHKAPKLVENTKNVLLLRGKKTSATITQLLRDLRMINSLHSKLLNKRNDFHAFDNESHIEFLTQKNDTSLFLVGSHTKKRPQNCVLGRTFDGHVLDMMELEISNYKAMATFSSDRKKAVGSKPCFIFTGSEWETLETYQKLKNLLLDLFRGTVVEGINVNGLDHVIVCTSFQNKVVFRCYSIILTKAIDNRPRVDLNEMGPRFDIGFRRSKFASADLMRAATKKPKELAPKKLKNVSRDDLTGDKLGQIHLDRQDVYSMQTRRVKALRKTPGNLKKEKVAEPQDDS